MGRAFAHLSPEAMSHLSTLTTLTPLIAAALLGACITGCSSARFRYVPAQHQAPGRQKTLAIYPDPAGPQSGVVRVSSLGIVTLRPKSDSKDFPALHVRLSVSNQTQQSWLLNSEDQRVSFPNHGQTQPVFVNSDTEGLPHLKIGPGELRTLDLYFPLPQAVSEAKDLPEFDFYWSFVAGAKQVAQMTPFERQPIPERPPVVYPYLPGPYLSFGWGRRWWYGPRPYWW